MKLPRDLPGHELAKLLRRYGYEVVRRSGSHLQLQTRIRGSDHMVTVPAHRTLKAGTLNAILSKVAAYLEKDRSQLLQDLFG